VLARSTNGEGTLELVVDKIGVKYRFEAPDTSLGDEVLSGVRRGDIRTSSFAFTVRKDEDAQDWKQEGDKWHRTIKRFDKIYDVSPVYREAYSDTTVAVRSLVDIRTSEAEKAKQEAEKKVADLEEELRQKEAPSTSTDVAEVKEPEKVEEKKPSFAELESYFKGLEDKMSNLNKK
jgi:HK97 family phage prohead protease